MLTACPSRCILTGMKISKAERQLIALEKTLKLARKQIVGIIRTINPKSRHAVKDIALPGRNSLADRADRVDKDIIAKALRSFSIERGDSGWHVYPPEAKLSATLWNRIKKVMSDNGGDWMAQRQAFVFEEDPTHIFHAAEDGKLANVKKDYQSFYTPHLLARKIAILADVNGHIVLEPSAGDGALAEACLKQGAAGVTCYEISEAAVEKLRAKNFAAAHGDFLEMLPGLSLYYRIVMNPPFAKDAYIKHIMHALGFLHAGGKLVAIIPGDSVSPKLAAVLRPYTWSIKRLGKGAFKESGTDIATCVLTVNG